MPLSHHAPLILASGSAIRQHMLKAAGLIVSIEVSGVDEDAVAAQHADKPMPQRAVELARAKAMAVSRNHPQSYVIGADQICALGNEVLHKPGTYEKAQAQLEALSGRKHHQHCGTVLVKGGETVWEHAATATLTFRSLTAQDIHAYIAADAPLSSCGSYKFESLGRHLFAAVEGDHDVVKGLPLVPLLAKLHELKLISLA